MRICFLISLFLTIFILGACSEPISKSNSATSRETANRASDSTSNEANSLSTTKTPEATLNNSGETLVRVIDGYYAALQKKDEAGVKRFLSADAISYWQAEAKTEKASILKLITDIEAPLDEKREVRNEKIENTFAVAELKGGSYGVWTKVKFVKENGEWKFASPLDSPELIAK